MPKAFSRNRDARVHIRKQSQRLGYPSVVSVFQNLSKEKRDELADKYPLFYKLEKRIPYHWDCVGHIVFDLFFKTWKLRHLITFAKFRMYGFFYTTTLLPLELREWLREKLNHKDGTGIHRDSVPFLNRAGTVINYFFVEYIATSHIIRTTVPLLINNLAINFHIGDKYFPNFFKQFEKSKIRNLDFNAETMPDFMNDEELLQTVFEDMTKLTVQNVRVFAHMVPTASLQRLWTMKAQTMELRDEFTSGPRFLQVCEDLRSGKVPFNRFQYTGYVRMTGDQFDGFWNQVKERVGFGIDDDVRVNGNSIHFKTSDGNLGIEMSFKKLMFPFNCYQLSAKMDKEKDNSWKFQLPATVSCFLPKIKRTINHLLYINVIQISIVIPLITFPIVFLLFNVLIGSYIMVLILAALHANCVVVFYLTMRLILAEWH
ncbi:hypothetical protein L5515_007283 [Caenorhabditis briggsae]|uniref:Uncharacterized protein n=1 Tax=Caenorhabditis briggsae TaxID=6238 RepID=A0AAE9JJW1_CAEBR|nr:hypothetical protein L5515_007283 [Caenorhabditis briggsae]